MTKEEAFTAFISALRSGEYKQGTGLLGEAGKHCAEGVLCEIAVEAGVCASRTTADAYTGLPVKEFQAPDGAWNDTIPPPEVTDWAGIPRHRFIVIHGAAYYVWELNDSRRFTFEKIADVLEKWHNKNEELTTA